MIKPAEKWDKVDEVLNRGVDTIYPSKEELEQKLRSEDKLRIYWGIDPTGDQMHIGHTAALWKLRQFQETGHQIILLIGDVTATIGDPSGKIQGARKKHSREEVKKNAQNYKKQAEKIINFDGDNPAELRFNSEWFDQMSAMDFLQLSREVTFQQIIKRNLFKQRMKMGEEIYANEFIYPLMQAYDTVKLDADVEIGGTDQLFNMMVGRDIMKKIKSKEKFVITVPLITDGKGKKIGKSEGNVISITNKHAKLFGQIMSLPDSAIAPCFELITNLSMTKVQKIKKQLNKGKDNPIKLKKKLAWTLVKQFNNEKKANKAQEEFEKKYQQKNRGEVAEHLELTKPVPIIELILEHTDRGSRGQVKRLIKQGGVEINNKKVKDFTLVYKPSSGDIIEIGKHKIFKIAE